MRGCDEVRASLKEIRGAHEQLVLTALTLKPKRLAFRLPVDSLFKNVLFAE